MNRPTTFAMMMFAVLVANAALELSARAIVPLTMWTGLAPPDVVADRAPGPDPLDGPPPSDAENEQRSSTEADYLEIELRCDTIPERTFITNTSDKDITVTEVRSLAGPLVSGEKGAPDPNFRIPPGETITYETGAGADKATGGIQNEIYNNDRLSEEGARIRTGTGKSMEAHCTS